MLQCAWHGNKSDVSNMMSVGPSQLQPHVSRPEDNTILQDMSGKEACTHYRSSRNGSAPDEQDSVSSGFYVVLRRRAASANPPNVETSRL
ncbi:hypothetical protein CRENBAI_002512 [Crenichthys baileyi]|uniref:Uncharacterized protein n=1 Tax=Crenichthys baileyi TaxID=28760 RepID=A0AAV9R278_9TELE